MRGIRADVSEPEKVRKRVNSEPCVPDPHRSPHFPGDESRLRGFSFSAAAGLAL